MTNMLVCSEQSMNESKYVNINALLSYIRRATSEAIKRRNKSRIHLP